eukprot:Phypoly_transcript_11799.p1 GENE.Phypoly_transcript_11799~~Phypoly_transcript_11799.p1  ORF type:complete len:344 (+),score=27.53 Phypoly_transcript_11799:83-1033(+)
MEAIFEDPVTFEVMRDAVVSTCGHSFSQASLAQWLKNHDTCPICKHQLKLDECTPNYALRNAIDQYVKATSPPAPPSPVQERSSSLNRININAIINSTNETYSTIREIRSDHTEQASHILESSFRDCSYTNYFYPDGGNFKIQAMNWFYSKMIQYALKNGRVWAAYDEDMPYKLQGVAIWQPPYESGVSFWNMLKTGMGTAPWNLGVKPAWRILSVLDQVEKMHQKTITRPHWSLYSISVDPALQCRGIGTKMMKPILDMADYDGLPCYLDTPSERSLKFFRRLGFEVIYDVSNPSSGPRFWTMVRNPQPVHRLRH